MNMSAKDEAALNDLCLLIRDLQEAEGKRVAARRALAVHLDSAPTTAEVPDPLLGEAIAKLGTLTFEIWGKQLVPAYRPEGAP